MERLHYSNRNRGADLAFDLLRLQDASQRQLGEFHAGNGCNGGNDGDDIHDPDDNNDNRHLRNSILDAAASPFASSPLSFFLSDSSSNSSSCSTAWEAPHTLASPFSMAQYPLKEVSTNQPRTVTFSTPEPLRPDLSQNRQSSRSQSPQNKQQPPQGRHSLGDTSRLPLDPRLRRKFMSEQKSGIGAFSDGFESGGDGDDDGDDGPRQVLRRPGEAPHRTQKPAVPPLSLTKDEGTSRSSYESSLGMSDFWAPEGGKSLSIWSPSSVSPTESSSKSQPAARNSLELPYLGRRSDRELMMESYEDDVPAPLPPKSGFRLSPRADHPASFDKSPPPSARTNTNNINNINNDVIAPLEPRTSSRNSASTHSSAHTSAMSNRRRRSPPPPLRSSSPDDMDDRDKRYHDFTLKAIQEVMQQQQQQQQSQQQHQQQHLHQRKEDERRRRSSPMPSPRQVQFARNEDENDNDNDNERRKSGSSCHSCGRGNHNHQSQNLEGNLNLSVRGRQSTETNSPSPLRQRFNMRSLSPVKKKGSRSSRGSRGARASGDGFDNGFQASEFGATTPTSTASSPKKDKRISGEARKSRERRESEGNKDGTFLKNWGTKIKKNVADLTTGDGKKQQQNGRNSNLFQSRLAPAGSSQIPISLDPPTQAKLYSELELMLCVSANQFLLNQHKARRISVESFSKTLHDWAAQSRSNVPQFQFDQKTQCELVAANRRTLRFHGECAHSALELSACLRAWAGLAEDMSVRTFCATDSAVRKHLHDALKILEMLGAPSMTFLAFQELQVNALALMKREQERRMSETEPETPMPSDFFENRLSIDNAEPSCF